MMKYFRVIFLLAFFSLSYGQDRRVRKFGIVGGKETSISQLPYQAGFLVHGRHKCGGSIISSKCILTAAHCLNNSKKNITIRVGSSFRHKEGNVHKVEKIIMYPNFNAVKLKNDVGIIIVENEIMFDANVKPIALPETNFVIPDDTLCTVSGWGKTENNSKSDELRSVDVRIINRDVCQSLYNSPRVKFNVSDDMICAGFMEGGRDACSGDSGGPLACEIDGKKMQFGIVSSGFGCALENFPGIYAEVSKFRKWIVEHCTLPTL